MNVRPACREPGATKDDSIHVDRKSNFHKMKNYFFEK